MRRLLLLALCLTACAQPRPAAPPPYAPAGAPEPPTACPEEAAAARAARELTVGADDPGLAEAAARAVLALAGCEARSFDALPLTDGDDAEALAALRDQYRTVLVLFEEVGNHTSPAEAINAHVGAAHLHEGFAAKIRGARPPRDAAGWESERAAVLAHLDGAARAAYRRALALGEIYAGLSPADVAAACAALAAAGEPVRASVCR